MLDPRQRVTFVADKPLQGTQGDRKTRVVQLGGSSSPVEANMYLSVAELEQLLMLAKASPVKRVRLERVGLHVTQYMRSDGTEYEAWKLNCGWVRPDMK